MTTRAATYLRISLDRTGEHLGVDRQRDACRRICRERGWTAVEYMDNSVSASKERGTGTSYGRMLEDARAGRIGAVVVWDLDRLTRRPREIEDWIDLAVEHGVRLVTADGEIDTASGNGQMYMRIKAAVARQEIDQKSRRQKAAHEQRRAAEGSRPASGWRALGWEPDGMTLRPAEAALVRRGAEHLLGGGSLRSVSRMWNEAGITTSRGTPWQPYSVRDVMLNPRTAGFHPTLLGRGRWEIGPRGGWPPLLPEETWQALGRLLTDPQRRTAPDTRRRYLLAGLARCGVCGQSLTTGGTQHGVRTLKCGNGRHISRAAERIEEYVQAVIVARLERPDLAELARVDQGPDVAPLRETVLARRSALGNLLDAIADGTLTAAEARTRVPAARDALARAEADLAEAGRVNVLASFVAADDVPAAWEALDVDQRRAVIALLADVVVLSPGRGARTFRPETVEIQWVTA